LENREIGKSENTRCGKLGNRESGKSENTERVKIGKLGKWKIGKHGDEKPWPPKEIVLV
jgi:hypothetical protein